MEINKIYCEPCEVTLSRMKPGGFTNCITSPPYYGLRDYGTAKWEGGSADCDHLNGSLQSTKSTLGGRLPEQTLNDKRTKSGMPFKDVCAKCGAIRIDEQIGLEETPEAYVQRLVAVFHEVKRVMADDGTLWLNLGDSYSGSGGAGNQFGQLEKDGFNKYKQGKTGLKPKDLIGIPWAVAFALRADGWYLRQDIIWNKPNPMPESVTDRCTKAHEYIFLLSKSAKYYYDAEAIKEKSEYGGYKDAQVFNGKNGINKDEPKWDKFGVETRNKRSVWEVTTKPFKEAHFAVYPEELIEPCVLTTKKDAVIYDPFGGSGTTGVVALRAGRKFIMSELNPEYVKIAEKRLSPHLHNLFTDTDNSTQIKLL